MPGYKKVRYRIDVRDVVKELNNLEEQPSELTRQEFESIAINLFQETQFAVHVETGSLKTSGRLRTQHRGKVFAANITYGGASPGSVHDPVRYALFEFARGGSHNFLSPVEHADARWYGAMLEALRGNK